jgi:flagellar FliL protein
MNRMVVVGIVAVVALAAGIGGGYVAGQMLLPSDKKEKKPEAASASVPERPDPDLFYELPETLVALRSDTPQAPLLKFGVDVEFESVGDKIEMERYLPRVLDVFQVYVRTLQLKDLRGVAGLQRFREGLRQHIQGVVAPGRIKAVMFRDISVE